MLAPVMARGYGITHHITVHHKITNRNPRFCCYTLASGTPPPAFRALPPQPAAPPLALGRARRSSAAQTDAAIAASARGDALTTTLGYVQRRAALRDITNHI